MVFFAVVVVVEAAGENLKLATLGSERVERTKRPITASIKVASQAARSWLDKTAKFFWLISRALMVTHKSFKNIWTEVFGEWLVCMISQTYLVCTNLKYRSEYVINIMEIVWTYLFIFGKKKSEITCYLSNLRNKLWCEIEKNKFIGAHIHRRVGRITDDVTI